MTRAVATAPLGVVGLVVAVVVVWPLAAPKTSPAAAVTGEVTLFGSPTHGPSGPLFAEDALVPGRAQTRCWDVSYAGKLPAELVLSARASGPLARSLQVQLAEVVAGACAPGALLWSGPLEALSAPGGSGAFDRLGAGRSTRTYAVTTVIDDDDELQGLAAAATLVLQATSVGELPPAPPPSATPSAPRPPAVIGTPGAPPDGNASAGPSGESPPDVSAAAGAQPPDGAGLGLSDRPNRPTIVLEAPEAGFVLPSWVSGGAARGSFPVALVILLLAFLAVQDRLDRADPKLAQAPRHDDQQLSFPSRGTLAADAARAGAGAAVRA